MVSPCANFLPWRTTGTCRVLAQVHEQAFGPRPAEAPGGYCSPMPDRIHHAVSLCDVQISSGFGRKEGTRSPTAPRTHRSARYQKKVAKVDIELANLTSWAEKLQEESNRQAGLSVQYLHTRFEKGKEKVNAFSAKSHRYITGENFLAGPAEIQRISGRFGTNQPYLGRAFVFQDGLN